jgi:hypothetical protein
VRDVKIHPDLFGGDRGSECARAETSSSTSCYPGAPVSPAKTVQFAFAAGSGACRFAVGAVDAALVLVHTPAPRRERWQA